MMASARVRPSFFRARSRRSPAMSSYFPGPTRRTSSGESSPCSRMDSASASMAASEKVRRGWAGLGERSLRLIWVRVRTGDFKILIFPITPGCIYSPAARAINVLKKFAAQAGNKVPA